MQHDYVRLASCIDSEQFQSERNDGELFFRERDNRNRNYESSSHSIKKINISPFLTFFSPQIIKQVLAFIDTPAVCLDDPEPPNILDCT